MTVALCTKCGNIKKGLLVPCDNCGIGSRNSDFELLFTDHYISEITIRDFGALISKLQDSAIDKSVAEWAFYYIINTYYPEFGISDIPPTYTESSKELVKELVLDNIIIEDGPILSNIDDKYATMVKHYKTNCPFCKSSMSFAAWHVLNGTSDANLKSGLNEGRFFRSKCMRCDKVHSVYYDMIYFDIEYNPAVILLKDSLSDISHEMKTVTKDYFEELFEGFNYRKVRSQNELIEKVRIFRDDLDDIEVELAKHIIHSSSESKKNSSLVYSHKRSNIIKGQSLVFKNSINQSDSILYSMRKHAEQRRYLISLMKKRLNKDKHDWLVINQDRVETLLGEIGVKIP
ncbi:hypothetical protein A8B79_05930 [Balneola sp. EhC07]|uniref:CpXC domain-containing protein n=1 Tax=Balneola sp. EhC07 TaxID=1849360 RepID=UPI0007F41B32|nr:CpXC domain-containing protein [Balneola sp. EhC07]OAN61013.1 hypothetical protein A8B79_05930 [Balneola sp. EhC07]